MEKFIKSIGTIENIIGYTFRDKSLLTQAFTRGSFCNEANVRAGVRYQSNEVLEFFGDSVLSCAIVTLLIRERSERYEHGIKTELDEGDFSVIRSNLSDKKNLSENIGRLGLEKYLIMGEGDVKVGIMNEPSVKEDLLESIIGAVYIDSGFSLESAISVVSKMLDTSVYLRRVSIPSQSPKNALQEWCADKKRRLPPPEYRTVEESGPDHDRHYRVRCYIDGVPYGEGEGKSLKAAGTEAARLTLDMLKEKFGE
ncbi:MAG: hypothetical protein IJF38_03390 [Clostridia bacterium]|nr:hypothetical protein [Clostridia bacterium]